jgi:hypothetical protein
MVKHHKDHRREPRNVPATSTGPVDYPFLHPTPMLLAKLGSILVHVEETWSPGGHELDRAAAETLLRQPDVQAWLADGRAMAMVPEKRR